ncbi:MULTISPECIES: arginine deiminase [Caloramator]|uniref:Arginine deiminase n=1 Tax=Caloramator proteoclasticus DSM 10124 TaxID=1121262 RepID=A0A1M4XVW5_9CLOT|nr:MULTISPECIES: arginine deiminase [Caloramator]SHE97555.1 arginine deiminase [Caloramator proteoclasticus DSM 10124]
MNSLINITSEIGKLKKVLLHRPGNEVENLVPEYLGRLLFDDIPYLKIAQEEHDKFAQVLRENDVEVVYLEELATSALSDDKIKIEFLEEMMDESRINSPSLRQALIEYLLSMPTSSMVDKIMSGIRKEEIKIKEVTSLADLMMDDYPFYLDPMPNLYFTRDPGAAIGNGITLNKMHTEARRRETLFLKYIHKYHKDFKESNIPLWYDRTLPFSIEGGDELILSSKVVAIGCSERTSPEAIEIVAKNLFKENTGFEKVLVFEIPKCRAFMHLDTVFTMVDYDKFTIHPAIQGPLSVYEVTKGANNTLKFKHNTSPLEEILKDALKLDSVELIKCGGGDFIVAGREQWNDGSNTLSIAPGVVITYERNYVTNEILDKKGIKVLSIPSSELSRGRGGPRCMSMPLYRENINL